MKTQKLFAVGLLSFGLLGVASARAGADFKSVKQKAEGGDAQSQNLLAVSYDQGLNPAALRRTCRRFEAALSIMASGWLFVG